MCDAMCRWLNIGLDFLGACVVLAAAIFAVVERNAEAGVTGSIVGLSISYALQVPCFVLNLTIDKSFSGFPHNFCIKQNLKM